jgi:hypothetical protein
MTTLSTRLQRRDLHNINVHYAAAMAGYCAMTHVASGRVCLLAHHHSGPCELRPNPAAALAAAPRTDSS